jgi:putative phage-type endonuclease
MTEEIVQGSDAWKALRCGLVTASRVADIVAKTKTGVSAMRANYLAQLICERLTGVVADSYTSPAMANGTETEPEARSAYEFYESVTVEEVSFVIHPTINNAGASPDGLVSTGGLVEIKCPQPAAHLETLIGQSVPGKYVTQIMWQLSCTGRPWCDYVSYNPTFPENMRLFVKRVERDPARIKELEGEVAAFLLELAVKLSQLNSLYGEKEAA